MSGFQPKKSPDYQSSSIVLVGSFNPTIFQPVWFAANELITQKESESAEIRIGHKDFWSFKLDWLNLVVTRNKLQAITEQEAYYEILRDLIIGTFKLLRHTPIYQLGINLDMHFGSSSEEKWHSFGDAVTPKEIWKDLIEKPGLLSLSMLGNKDREGLKGFNRVTIEPSQRINPGVYCKVNDHYDGTDEPKTAGSTEMIEVLENNWTKSIERSRTIIYKLFDKQAQ